MKVIRLGLILLSVAGVSFCATDGDYEIKAYSPETGIVEIRCGTQYTNRPFSSFSAAEQRKITKLLADKAFENSDLRITVEKKKTADNISEENKGRTQRSETEYVSYVVTLENQTAVEIDHITVESRTFYETDNGTDRTKKVRTERYQVSLRPGEKKVMEMGFVVIRDEVTMSGGGYGIVGVSVSSFGGVQTTTAEKPMNTTRINDRLAGMHLDVSRVDRHGETITREEEDGNPPPKDRWSKYRNSKTIDHAPEKNKTQTEQSGSISKNGVGPLLSEEQIQTYTKQADRGSHMSAYVVCRHYSALKDQAKAKQWADKTRELLDRLPAEQQTTKIKMFDALDLWEKRAAER